MRTIICSGKVIAREAKLLTSRLRQTCGLMFSRQKNLIFALKKEKRVRMHMFFVVYPIDVVLLNSRKEVIELKKEFRPFTVYFPKNAARYILELESQTILEKGIKVGDQVSFDPSIDD